MLSIGESPKKGCQLPDTRHYFPLGAIYLLSATMLTMVSATMLAMALWSVILTPIYAIVTMLRITLAVTSVQLMVNIVVVARRMSMRQTSATIAT